MAGRDGGALPTGQMAAGHVHRPGRLILPRRRRVKPQAAALAGSPWLLLGRSTGWLTVTPPYWCPPRCGWACLSEAQRDLPRATTTRSALTLDTAGRLAGAAFRLRASAWWDRGSPWTGRGSPDITLPLCPTCVLEPAWPGACGSAQTHGEKQEARERAGRGTGHDRRYTHSAPSTSA